MPTREEVAEANEAKGSRRAAALAAFSDLDEFLQEEGSSVVFRRADTWVDMTLINEGAKPCVITAPDARTAALAVREHYCPGYAIEVCESGGVTSQERIES